MEEKVIKVAILRKTNNLENDDRLRKEVASLTSLFPNVRFKAFVMLENNLEQESVTSYNLPFRSVHLATRDKYPGGSHLIVKSWDYYKTIKNEIKDYDFIWNSGDEPTPSLMYIWGKKLIWDLRELPLFLMKNTFKKIILKIIFKKCIICLHANQYRIDYLKQSGIIKDESKHYSLRNFPEFSTIDSEYDNRYYEVKNWIGNRKCVYLQGLSNGSRAAIECISAVLNTADLCAIVLGHFYDKALEALNQKYGETVLKERICFAGNFKVLKIPQYMALCDLSLVFYKNTSPNNYYCEANRLYQAIDAGLPVVVGSNPSMKSVVEELGVGISVNTDGNDICRIEDGISSLISNYDIYKGNISKLKDEIKWDSQIPLLKKIFEPIFN